MTYKAKGDVYSVKMGPLFSRTVSRDIEAETDDEALELAKKDIEEYCAALKKHHGSDFAYCNIRAEKILSDAES